MDAKRVQISNRQALRDYSVVRSYEAGLQLKGNEVKSLRNGKANLKGSFAKVENGELFLYNMHISPYKYSQEDYDPLRPRKLLLHKNQIEQLITGAQQKGHTIIPLKVYFTRGYAKAEIALAKGKRAYDKRVAIKEKEAQRDIERAMRDKK